MVCEAMQYKFRVDYIDTSDLLENLPLVKFVRNYIQDRSDLFSRSSVMRKSMTFFFFISRFFTAFCANSLSIK